MEESKNNLGLDEDDYQNMKMVLDDLIEGIVTFNSMDGVSENDWAEFKAILDFANYVVSGIIYANGYGLCLHDDEDGEVEYDDDDE